MIDLYYWPTGNGLKVGILLEELGVEYRLVPVNIREGQQKQADFQRISANGRIPAIVDFRGDVPLSLFESGAILNYLADKAGRFLPAAGTAERQKVQEWLFWQVGHITPYLSQLQVFKEKTPQPSPFALDLLNAEASRLYRVLEQRLREVPYVAGGYSVAGMAIFPWTPPERQGQNLAGSPHIRASRRRSK